MGGPLHSVHKSTIHLNLYRRRKRDTKLDFSSFDVVWADFQALVCLKEGVLWFLGTTTPFLIATPLIPGIVPWRLRSDSFSNFWRFISIFTLKMDVIIVISLSPVVQKLLVFFVTFACLPPHNRFSFC